MVDDDAGDEMMTYNRHSDDGRKNLSLAMLQ